VPQSLMSDRSLSNESIQKWPTEISDRLQNPRCRATWWCPCVSAVAGGARRGRTGTGRARPKPAHGGRKRRRRRRRCLQEERCLRHWTGLRESPALGRAMACGGDGVLAPPRGPRWPIDHAARASLAEAPPARARSSLMGSLPLHTEWPWSCVARLAGGDEDKASDNSETREARHGGPRPGTPSSSSFLSMDLPGTGASTNKAAQLCRRWCASRNDCFDLISSWASFPCSVQRTRSRGRIMNPPFLRKQFALSAERILTKPWRSLTVVPHERW